VTGDKMALPMSHADLEFRGWGGNETPVSTNTRTVHKTASERCPLPRVALNFNTSNGAVCLMLNLADLQGLMQVGLMLTPTLGWGPESTSDPCDVVWPCGHYKISTWRHTAAKARKVHRLHHQAQTRLHRSQTPLSLGSTLLDPTRSWCSVTGPGD
jgi:hypothetical protein